MHKNGLTMNQNEKKYPKIIIIVRSFRQFQYHKCFDKSQKNAKELRQEIHETVNSKKECKVNKSLKLDRTFEKIFL